MSEDRGGDLAPSDAESIAVKPSSQRGEETTPRKAWRFVTADCGRSPRWLVAFVVLVTCIGGLFASSFSICSEETVTKGADKTITHTCNGPAVSDAGVVAVTLFIVLLLAPDMSEVGVFGVSLKRRLAAAEEKATESAAKAELLETRLLIQTARIDSLSQSSAAASAHATNNFFLNEIPNHGEVVRDAVSKIREKERTRDEPLQRHGAPEPVPGPAFDYPAEPVPTELGLAQRLILNWEILAASLDLPPSRRGRRPDLQWIKVSASQAERFQGLFADELQVVRAARNSVTHASPITDEELQAAVNVSEGLLRILRGEALST